QKNLDRKPKRLNNIFITSFTCAPCTSFSCTIQRNIFIDYFLNAGFFNSLIVETHFFKQKLHLERDSTTSHIFTSLDKMLWSLCGQHFLFKKELALGMLQR
uniref:Uncharacterized protein n=1 Tax=Scleropages formosus TaxID=113540 RepID=A0A8C9SJB1_SCLFO